MVEVVGARQSRSGRGRRGPWSMWSELGGAARYVVDVVHGRLNMARLWLGVGIWDVVERVHGVVVVVGPRAGALRTCIAET